MTGGGGAAGSDMSWITTARAFLSDVRGELKRTTFPSQREVKGTTTVVIVTVFVFAFYLWVVDTFLYKVIEWIFDLAG
jgi:preprotein translocase subunit SecE